MRLVREERRVRRVRRRRRRRTHRKAGGMWECMVYIRETAAKFPARSFILVDMVDRYMVEYVKKDKTNEKRVTVGK